MGVDHRGPPAAATSSAWLTLAALPHFHSMRLASTSSASPTGSPTSTQPDPPKKSSAVLPAVAIVGAVGGILLYNTQKTGSPDRIAKAMAKTGTPSQQSGGLGKMEAESKRLHMGEKSSNELHGEPVENKPPTTRPVRS